MCRVTILLWTTVVCSQLVAMLICCLIQAAENAKSATKVSKSSIATDLLPNKSGKAKFIVFYYAAAPTNAEVFERFDELIKRFGKEKSFGKKVIFERYECSAKPHATIAAASHCDAAENAGQATMALVPLTANTPDDIVPYPGLMRTNAIINYLRQTLRFSTAEALRKTRYASQPQAERLQPEELENRIGRFHQANFFIMFYDDPRMLHLWDRMALEFFGEEQKVTFLTVNCSYTINDKGTVEHRTGICQEFAPEISHSLSTMLWFRGAKLAYKYEAAWTPFDLVKFVNIIAKGAKEIQNRTEPDGASGMLREARDNVTGLYKEVKDELDKRYAKNSIDYHEGVHDVSRHNFVEHTQKSGGAHLVFFYTPWDVWSHELSFALIDTAAKFLTDADVFIDRVDCFRHGSACHEFNFTSYPQLVWMTGNFIRIPYQYEYHTYDELERFVRTMKRFVRAEQDPHLITSSELFAERLSDGVEFTERVRTAEQDTFVLFYTASGCQSCLNIMPYWEAAAHELQSQRMHDTFPVIDQLLVAKMDCGDGEENLGFCVQKLRLNTFPAIVLFRSSSGGDVEFVFSNKNKTTSVHELVQFALRSLGAYDVGDEAIRHATLIKPAETDKVVEKTDAKKTKNESVAVTPPKAATTTEFSDDDIDMIKALNGEAEFDATVKSGLTVVMLIKNDCSLCDELRRPLNRLAFGLDFVPRVISGDLTVATVNCDINAGLCARYFDSSGDKQQSVSNNKKTGIPSLHAFYNGKHVGQLGGTTEVQFISDLMSIIPLPKMEL